MVDYCGDLPETGLNWNEKIPNTPLLLPVWFRPHICRTDAPHLTVFITIGHGKSINVKNMLLSCVLMVNFLGEASILFNHLFNELYQTAYPCVCFYKQVVPTTGHKSRDK